MNNHNLMIEEWMKGALRGRSIENYEDLHIDRIDSAWKAPRLWVDAGMEALSIASDIRMTSELPISVALVFALRGQEKRVGLDLQTRKELEALFDRTPPSLYLFNLGKEPWASSSSSSAEGLIVEELPATLLNALLSRKANRGLYLEFKSPLSEVYSRSLCITE